MISHLGRLLPFCILCFPGKTQMNSIKAQGSNGFVRPLADFHRDPITQPKAAA